MNHPPVCVKCKRELKRERSGVGLLDFFNPTRRICPDCKRGDTVDEKEGTNRYYCTECKKPIDPIEDNTPQPYQIWDADLWKCSKCGYEVVLDFGNNPIARHFEKEEMQKEIDRYITYSRLISNFQYGGER